MTFEVQDVVSRAYLRPATLHFNGQDRSAPVVLNDVVNGTNFVVGASSLGYMDTVPKPVTAMAVGNAATASSLQYVTLMAPTVVKSTFRSFQNCDRLFFSSSRSTSIFYVELGIQKAMLDIRRT